MDGCCRLQQQVSLAEVTHEGGSAAGEPPRVVQRALRDDHVLAYANPLHIRLFFAPDLAVGKDQDPCGVARCAPRRDNPGLDGEFGRCVGRVRRLFRLPAERGEQAAPLSPCSLTSEAGAGRFTATEGFAAPGRSAASGVATTLGGLGAAVLAAGPR